MFYRSHVRTTLFLGLAVAGLIATAGPVSAYANERDSDSMTVAARELDLRTPTGAASLRHRVAIAAYNVCAEGKPGDAISSAAFRDCVNAAIRRASRRVETLIAAAQGATMLASAAGPSR